MLLETGMSDLDAAYQAEQEAYARMQEAAGVYAVLCAYHGDTHLLHDEYRELFRTARADWFSASDRLSIAQATHKSIDAVHAAQVNGTHE